MSPTTPPITEEDRGRWLMSLTALAVHLSSAQIERAPAEPSGVRKESAAGEGESS